MVQCAHGFHHSATPHSCDWREGDRCPYEALSDKRDQDLKRANL